MKPRIRWSWKSQAWLPTSRNFIPAAELDACKALNDAIYRYTPQPPIVDFNMAQTVYWTVQAEGPFDFTGIQYGDGPVLQ